MSEDGYERDVNYFGGSSCRKFKLLLWQASGGTKKNHKEPQQKQSVAKPKSKLWSS
jgi:hypothetical protein